MSANLKKVIDTVKSVVKTGLGKTKDIIMLIIIVILILISVFIYWNFNDKIKNRDFKITLLNIGYDSLLNTKTSVDTIIDTVVIKIKGKVIIHEVEIPSVKIYYDTIKKNEDLLLRHYEGSYNTKDFELPYDIKLFGHLKKIDFGDYKLFREKIIEERVVVKPYPVTLPAENHLYISFAAGFCMHPTVEAGLGYQLKNGFIFEARYQRLRDWNIYKMGILLKIK